jgi:hypothetical protein
MAAVPRLFGGGPCPAGRDFLVITSDRRVSPCSFHHLSFPFEDAADVLRIWAERRADLAAAAQLPGCARLPEYGLGEARRPLPTIGATP